MIEITKRDHMGVQQTIEYITEEEFGKQWWPNTIKDYFCIDTITQGEKEVYSTSFGIPFFVRSFYYTAYNKRGKVLTVDHLVGLARKYNVRYNRQITWRWYGGFKHGNCRYHRHPKTTQEKRWYGAWKDEEIIVKGRARRNARNLPETWDDIPRSSWFDSRSWKKYRKTQWKNKDC